MTVENSEIQEIPTGLRRIHIENVQSIADLTLDFEESGVYRLVGDNDVGKSAILRAINALFHNVSRSSYKEYISDWADTFVVEGWFYDGGYVKLSRGANDFYEWSIPSSGNIVMKTDGKVPPELEEYFNLYTEKDKSKLTLNFNLQGDVLPFVDTSASDNFWLTQKALGTNVLLNASKMLKKENQDNQKLVKNTIENIDYEVAISEKIANEIENDSSVLDLLSDGINVINEEYEELEILYDALNKEQSFKTLKENYENIPILSEQELSELYAQANDLNTIIKYRDYFVKVNNAKNSLRIIDDMLTKLNIEDLQKEINDFKFLKEVLEKEKYIDIMKDKLNSLTSKIISDDEIINCGNEIKLIESLKEYKNKLIKNNDLKLNLKTVDSKILNIDDEILKLKEEEKICPLCGSDLLKAHTH